MSSKFKTHCVHGHQLIGSNVRRYGRYTKKNGEVVQHRSCAECARIYSRAYAKKNRQMINAKNARRRIEAKLIGTLTEEQYQLLVAATKLIKMVNYGGHYSAFGEQKQLQNWAKQFNISLGTLYDRMDRGYSLEEALQLPKRYDIPLYSAFGKHKTLLEWATEFGMSKSVLYSRIIRHKIGVQEALQLRKQRHIPRYFAFREHKTLQEWANKFGMKKSNLYRRMRKHNFNVEEAVKRRRYDRPRHLAFGEYKTLREWATEFGMKRCTLYKRIYRHNFSVEEALEN